MGEITIDVTDWEDKVKQAEQTIANAEDLIQLAKEGVKTGDLALVLLISQYWGMVDDNRIRSSKANLWYGGLNNVQNILRGINKTVKINDISYQFHQFIGRLDEEDGAYVSSNSKEGIERARKNLRERVLRYIKRQVIVLYEGKQDWEDELEGLKDSIDELIEALSQPEPK
jgi:hypothetical protein